jgi:phosphosulfolactate synthase
MNYSLSHVPERTAQPRNNGITMVMDKGLSLAEAENFLSKGAKFVDIVKLGWATSYITENLIISFSKYTRLFWRDTL